jgi:hypothetical protein
MHSLRAYIAVTGIAFAAAIAFHSKVSAQGMSSETKTWCQRVVPALREVLRQDPAKAAKVASDSGDLTYLEVHGIGAYIPSVKDQLCARNARVVQLLEGTSDALCSTEHGELQGPAQQFAKTYNMHIAIQRRARGLMTCNED